jgi:hypothetical protein
MRALRKSLGLSDYTDFDLIAQILQVTLYLRNRYLICAIKDFWAFSETFL